MFIITICKSNHYWKPCFFTESEADANDEDHDDEDDEDMERNEAMDALQLRELFYLWQLAGGDGQSELRKHGLVVNMPPILNLPNLIVSRLPSGIALAFQKIRGQNWFLDS